MKTKILAKIALCLLLLTLPAAAASDCTLDIFGNANEDETINMQDVTYTELIILEYRDETELSDAKYDGKINMQDVTQIELVILGKEKELTILDDHPWNDPTRVPVTIKKPLERVVVAGTHGNQEAAMMRIFGMADKIVGVSERLKESETYFPELSKLPSIGSRTSIDYEAVLSLNPDVYLGFYAERDKLSGIPVLSLRFGWIGEYPMPERIRVYGYLFDEREKAEELIDWYENYRDIIAESRESIPEDEWPTVFYGFYYQGALRMHITSGQGDMLETLPCKNIGKNLPGGSGHPVIDPEFVIEQNPDIMIMSASRIVETENCGMETNDPSEMAAAREDLMNDVLFTELEAVKSGRVYLEAFSGTGLIYSPGHHGGSAYLGHWFHPDFTPLDPYEIHQEYYDLQGFDFDVREQGVFVYPVEPPSYPSEE